MLPIKRLAIIIVCCLTYAACVPFQVHDTPPVYGLALDSVTAAPVPNAKIRIVPVERTDVAQTVTADSTGRFQVDAISHRMWLPLLPWDVPGGYRRARIEAAAEGYEANAQDLTAARRAMSTTGEVLVYLKRQ